MPFYDALKYILTTANGKIRRKTWLDGYYVCRGFEGKILKILLIAPHGIDNVFDYECCWCGLLDDDRTRTKTHNSKNLVNKRQ